MEDGEQNSKKRKQKDDSNKMDYELTSDGSVTSRMETFCPIHTVPIVIMEQIFSYLAPAELQICAFVCKRWKATYESYMDKFEEIKIKEMQCFSPQEKDKTPVDVQAAIDKEFEFKGSGTIRVTRLDRTLFLFSIRTDKEVSVNHVKLDHNYGKWKTVDFEKVTPKNSLVHLIRDIIEAFVPFEKLHVSVPNEKEIEKNDPFLPRVNLDGCVQSFTDKALVTALKKNSYIRNLHFIGKEWLKESTSDTSWALACLADNFSITEATFQYAGVQVKKAESIAERNKRFIPIMRVFDWCNDDSILQLWAYQSLINEFGPKIIDSVALHYAAAKGMKDLTEALLSKKVDAFRPIPETEETPFMFALRSKNADIVKLFEKYVYSERGPQPLIGWCGEIERPPAEELLQGKPLGTFLTRYSARAQSYVVSLVAKDEQQVNLKVYHIAGWKKSDDGSVTAERPGGKYKYYGNLVEAIYEEMVELRYPMKCPLPSTQEWKDPKQK